MKKLITLTAFITTVFTMIAQDFTYNDVNYTVISATEHTCRTRSGSYSSPGNNYSGELTIPEIVYYNNEAFTVTEIGKCSFCNNKNIAGSLTIPNSVQTIGEDAFRECYGISELKLGESLENISRDAFYKCYKLYGTVVIPEKVQFISNCAFYDCPLSGLIIKSQCLNAIDSSAFTSHLQYIISYSFIVPDVFKYSFSDETLKGALFVPNEYLESYKKAYFWRDFVDIVGFDGECPIEAYCESQTIHIGETTYIDFISHCTNYDILDLTSNFSFSHTPTTLSIGTFSYEDTDEGTIAKLEIVGKEPGEGNFETVLLNIPFSFDFTVLPKESEGQDLTITLNVENMTLPVGQSDQLTATVLPENAADKTVTWSSDNEAVATVEDDGTVTAVSVGVANITASCGEVSAVCEVTVFEDAGVGSIYEDNNTLPAVYDILGVKINITTVEGLSSLQPGFYIVNGRKVFLK